MNENNGIELEHFGVISAKVDREAGKITLLRGSTGVKREVNETTIKRCLDWALSRCREKYPNYQLVIDGQEHS